MLETKIDINRLAMLALDAMASELPTTDYDLLDPSHQKAEMLSVQIDESLVKDFEREMRRVGRALGKACRERDYTAFAVPELPRAVESCAKVEAAGANLSLRVVRAFDAMEGRMFMRVDVIGASIRPIVMVRPLHSAARPPAD